jgi:Integrase zinc binding domain
MEEFIAQHLFWQQSRKQITKYVQTCPICQKNKKKVKKYRWLLPKEAETVPWDKLCIDLIALYYPKKRK